MAESSYPYALLVEFEPNKVPKLRNKLTKYFQSKKLSCGGDCTVELQDRTAVLRFRLQQDQKNVLEKESHSLDLNKDSLKLTVHLMGQEQEPPADKSDSKPVVYRESTSPGCAGDSAPSLGFLTVDSPTSLASDPSLLAPPLSFAAPTASEPPASLASVVENMTPDLMQDFVEMLVENIMKGSSCEGFTVEMIPALKCAVISFSTGLENAEFVRRCPLNMRFKSKSLTVQALAPPTQLLLDEVGIHEEVLCMFLEKEGVEVQKVEVNVDKRNTVVSLSSAADVQKLQQKPLMLRKRELKFYPFYQCLGRALYGSDKPPPKLPAPVIHQIDHALLKFISDRPSVLQSLLAQLKPVWCQLERVQGGVKLSPKAELLQEENMVEEWPETVRLALSEFLSQFEVYKLTPPEDLWKESQEKVSSLVKSHDQVLMIVDETDGVIKVVGSKQDIQHLQEPLCESINSLIKRVKREKAQVTEQIKVPMSVFKLLMRKGLEQDLLNKYPEIKLSTSGTFPRVTGLSDEIAKTNNAIYEKMLGLQRKNMDVDRHVLEFLNGEEQEERANAMLSQNNAVFEIMGSKIHLLALSDKDLTEAEELFKSVLVSKEVKAEDGGVLKSVKWKQLVEQFGKVKVSEKAHITTEGDQVIVSGFIDNVVKISHEIDSFLKQNAYIEQVVVVNHVAKLEYLQQIAKSKLDVLQDEKIKLSILKDGVSVNGSRADVKDRVGKVQTLIDSVAFETLTVSKHGAKKVFEDKEENYLTIIANKTGCWVKIEEGLDAKQVNPLAKPVYKIQTPNRVEVLVSLADMCSYPSDAIVNAAVEDLKLKSGLSAALLKACGPQLQVDCDNIIQTKGNLKPGDCELTNAGGSLKCRKIIHAVGPKYDQQNVSMVRAQLNRAVKRSLELAEQHQCQSLAIPAISRNRNFPLNECTQTVVRAVREHCENMSSKSVLKSIHLVSNEDAVVKAMEDSLKMEFGGVIATAAPPPPPAPTPIAAVVASSSASSPPASSPVDPSCVGRALTKEGLEIYIFKGNLEKAMTDVIVNTVNADLELTRGAVSNAILSAAGPALQTMVRAKQSKAAVGDVIVTEGANLKCQMVYHAVAPHYDNGQGTAQKQLSSVFRDCLSKAEATGHGSISLSAMGTGNLGFPRALVCSLLLESILEISKKQPQSLQQVQVALFPGDAQTIQVFSDEFHKKFPKVGTSTASATAPPGGSFSKIVSSSSSHETKMGGVTVQAVISDITKESTDVIVNSSNDKFSLKSGVSKAILAAAGPAVESECQILGSQPNSGLILTQPGNLRCKKILHLVGQTELAKIKAAVNDALQHVIKHNFTSVAFPAIGTGQGNVGARGVADSMFDAVIEVLNANPGSSLKTVKVVIFQSQMLKDFHDSMLQRSTGSDSKEKEKESGIMGMFGKLKSLFVPSAPQKAPATKDFTLEAVKPIPLFFHICGESTLKVQQAKKKIHSILSKTIQSVPIKDNAVLSLSENHRKTLMDLQRSTEVGIHVQSLNGDGSVLIEGLAADVLAVTTQVHQMLRAALQEEDLNQKAELLKAVVEWQYAPAAGEDYCSFDPKTSYELEQGLEKKLKEVKVKLNDQEFTVKLPRGPATSRSGASLNVRRLNKMSDLPESWEAMDTTSTKVLPVISGSEEYKTVEKLFKASCNRTISKIERVQNPVLWQSLQIKRRAMDQRNGHINNERRLFHGTSDDTVAFINEHGFNRSYAGKNATAYGKGTYFAVNASYSSSNTYSRPNANGDKFMYLCSVLTGDFTKGTSYMIEPPLKKNDSIERYDSVVDNPGAPTMFIIFHDSHAYPEYLITFK